MFSPSKFNQFTQKYKTRVHPIFYSFQHGVIFGPFFIMPFVIFSGFFLLYKDAPFFFKWLFHISFLKHGLVGIVISIFGMERPKLPCSDLYCHYRFPKLFIEDQGMEQEQYGLAVICLMGIAVVVSACTYGILKIRLRTKWWIALFNLYRVIFLWILLTYVIMWFRRGVCVKKYFVIIDIFLVKFVLYKWTMKWNSTTSMKGTNYICKYEVLANVIQNRFNAQSCYAQWSVTYMNTMNML